MIQLVFMFILYNLNYKKSTPFFLALIQNIKQHITLKPLKDKMEKGLRVVGQGSSAVDTSLWQMYWIYYSVLPSYGLTSLRTPPHAQPYKTRGSIHTYHVMSFLVWSN